MALGFDASKGVKAVVKATKKKPVSVSVPYAPTQKGKEAEEAARGHVTVPYAPTRAGKTAEKQAAKKKRAKRASNAKLLVILGKAPTKQVGGFDPAAALKEVEKLAGTELAGGPTGATSNPVRDLAKSEVKNLAEVAKENLQPGLHLNKPPTAKQTQAALALTTPTLGDEATASNVAQGAVDVAKDVGKLGSKSLKAKVARVKSIPERVKSAPRTAKKAATTPEGRRAAAKGAARTAKKHPVRTGYGAAAVSPVPLPGELDKRARAFAKGTADAVLQHPGETLATTGHGVLGFLTAPVALAGAGVKSAEQGNLDPLKAQGKEYLQGTEKMVSGLASGDPKKVEHTTLTETGLTPFIPAPHIIKRVGETDAYEGLRGRVRGKVEDRRSTTRDSRIKDEREAAEKGEYVSRKKAKKVKHAVEDSEHPGEQYVMRRAGRFREKQRSRHYVSRETARIQEEGAFAAKKHAENVSKPLRKSKGTNHKEQNDGEALRHFVKYGLPLDDSALAHVARLKKGYGDVEYGDHPVGGIHLDRHSAQYVLDHPEMLKGKRGAQLEKAVKAFDSQAEGIGTSERNRYLAQVQGLINPIRKDEGKHPILLPEERVPASVKSLLPKREKPWSRSEALDYIKGKQTELAKKIRKGLDGYMKPPEHGGAEGGISTTRADAYSDEMLHSFTREAKSEAARLGLREPAAYVADRVPSGLAGEDKAPNFAAQIPVKKIWPSRGRAAASGNAESSFESLVQHSIEGPRQRAALVKGLNRIFDKASRKVLNKRYLTQAQVERAINTHQVPEGTIFMRTQALKSLLEGEHHLSPEEFRRELMGEVEHGQKLSSGQELAGEMDAAQGLKGDKFAPMDANAIHELMAQMEPLGKVTKYAAHSTNFATRTILNSPGFAAIQIPQEGLPLAAALGQDVVNVPGAVKNLNDIAKLPVEDQAAIKAVVGSSVGVLGAPSTKALKSESFMNPIRAAGGTPAWRHAWNLVNGNTLTTFDRARAGLFREVAADAKVEGDFKRAVGGFKVWRRSANNLYKGMDEAVQEMKGMNRAERLAYTASHPVLGDRLMKAMNGMAGNWNSFTALEKHLAPLTIFYPFQRYSVLWMLYHFPLDHPVVATALATMGEVNAQEIQRLAAKTGSKPGILDYTLPVVQNGKGKEPTVLPAGLRTFPGLSTVQQAAVTGNPAQLLGELSPALSIPIEAAEGKNSYTGQDIGENGFLYMLRQAGNLSPFLRFLGVPDTGQTPSAAGNAFNEQDPLRKERSVLDPFIGQTAKQYGNTKKLERKFDEDYGAGKIGGPFDNPLVQKLLFGNNGHPEPKLLPKVLREIHSSEGASNFIHKAEEPTYGKTPPFTDEQTKLLEAVEDAWETGPTGTKKPKVKLTGGIGGTGSGGIGGHPVGGSIGGGIGGHPIGGGIGGHPVGGGIGG